MSKKINYASMYTLRPDGRYQGYWHELDAEGKPTGKRHTICDRDPEKLYFKIQEKETAHRLTFAEIAEKWKDERFDELSYKSQEAYKATFKRLKDQFGDMEIESVESSDVSQYLKFLALNKHFAKRTVQLHRDMMSQIYNKAIADGVTRYNPCDHAPMPKNLPSGTRGIPTDEAIDAVRKNTDAPFALFALICLYAGLRRGEALALRYEDIDRKAKLIHVSKSVEYIGEKAHIKQPKTERGKRDVVLLDALAREIPHGTGYIFAQENGEIISRWSYIKKWDHYCKAIGFEITAHQLRHGYATILYEAGVPDRDAQELLGHADITLTRNIYTHIRAGQKERTASKLNDYVDKMDTAQYNEK